MKSRFLTTLRLWRRRTARTARRVWALARELVLQTVPTGILGTYAAAQLSTATGVGFLTSLGFVGLSLFMVIGLALTRA